MPLRFQCPNCHQRMSVPTQKQGQKVKCPRCRRIVHVPARGADWEHGEGESATAGFASSLSDIPPQHSVVYPEPELPKEPLASDVPASVTVPRYVLYTQGFLLGAVALVFFVFGLIVGSRSRLEIGTAGDRQPVIVSGFIRYQGEKESEHPDGGSVVLLLPASKQPDENVSAAELGPEEAELGRNHQVRRMLHSLGGDYTRADEQGHYRVRAPSAGRYFLLVISKHTQRPENDYPAANDLAQLGRYVVPATELLKQHCYRWKELLLRDDKQLNVTF